MPFRPTNPASVMTNDDAPTYEIRKPLNNPTAAPTPRAASIAIHTGCSKLTMSATAVAPERPTMLPKDRSKSPIDSTNVSAVASTSRGTNDDGRNSTFCTWFCVRKTSGSSALKSTTTIAKTTSSP